MDPPPVEEGAGIGVIGGGGHVGLPLGTLLATSGYNVTLIDKNEDLMERIARGKLPLDEPRDEHRLEAALEAGAL